MQPNAKGLSVGARIECWSQEEGFLDCFFEAELQSVCRGRCVVQYLELLQEEGGQLTEEISLEQVRPAPPRIDLPGQDPNFSPGHSVEAYYQDGWWKGAVHKKVDQEYYICYFLSNGLEQLRLHYSQLRTPQEWIDGEWTIKGPLAWQSKESSESPENRMRLSLPSPQTPQSPSPARQPERRASPDSLSEDFILAEDEEDVDIENNSDAMPSEGETVSEPLASPSSGGTNESCQREEQGKSRSSQSGGQKGCDMVQRTKKNKETKRPPAEKSRKGKKRRRESSSEDEWTSDSWEGGTNAKKWGSKKRRRETASKDERTSDGWEGGKHGNGSGSKTLSAMTGEHAEDGNEQDALALVAAVDKSFPVFMNGSRTTELTRGCSPFGKNTVMRWSAKQCLMSDIMRRSVGDMKHLGLSSYELELQIERERREACKKRQETSSQGSQQTDMPEYATLMRNQDPAFGWSQNVLLGENCYTEEARELCENAWEQQNEEQLCAAVEPIEHAGECANTAVQDRFSFKAAYAGILEALLRKNMPDYRREYLLAELRSSLQISGRYHSKQRQRVLQRLGGFQP